MVGIIPVSEDTHIEVLSVTDTHVVSRYVSKGRVGVKGKAALHRVYTASHMCAPFLQRYNLMPYSYFKKDGKRYFLWQIQNSKEKEN